MSAQIIIQNAIAQLEAEKSKVYTEAADAKRGLLKSDLDTFTAAKQKEYDETVAMLKSKFDEAVAAKKSELELQVTEYADAKSKEVDSQIATLKSLIATEEVK